MKFAGSRVMYSIVIAILILLTSRVSMHADAGWSRPELIAQTEGDLASSMIAVFSDQSGQLHVLYPERPNEDTPIALSYVAWTGTHWSAPMDVLFDPYGGNMAYLSAALDSHQTLHAIWVGANNSLRYASVTLGGIASSKEWSVPITLGTAVGGGDIVVGQDDTLHVAYSAGTDAGSIILINSRDAGLTWTPPLQAVASPSQRFPIYASLAQDKTGRLHLAWTEVLLPDAWPPTGAYYAQSIDGGSSWSDTLQIAPENHGQIGVVAVGQNEVHLVWRSTIGGDGTFHQWSSDGGTTWSPPDRFDDRGGFSGPPSFAVDSENGLHFVIGHGYYATWEQGRLSDYVDVATSELRQTAQKSDAERAALAITRGNVVHVVFENDFTSLWHTSKSLAVAPLQTTEPLPKVEPRSQVQVQPTATLKKADFMATAEVTANTSLIRGGTSSSSTAIGVGGGTAALLVGVVVLIATRKRARGR